MRILAILAGVHLLSISTANASVITLDFDSPDLGTTGCTSSWYSGPSVCTGTYLEDGFRLTAMHCHFDLPVDANLYNGSPWMGFDRGGSCAPVSEPAHLRLDFFGRSFDLLSLAVAQLSWTSVRSSAGGMVAGCAQTVMAPLCIGTIAFAGEEWRNLTYVDFFSESDPGLPVGFDDVRVLAIPEAPTVALLAGGLLLLVAFAGTRRRRAGLRAL